MVVFRIRLHKGVELNCTPFMNTCAMIDTWVEHGVKATTHPSNGVMVKGKSPAALSLAPPPHSTEPPLRADGTAAPRPRRTNQHNEAPYFFIATAIRLRRPSGKNGRVNAIGVYGYATLKGCLTTGRYATCLQLRCGGSSLLFLRGRGDVSLSIPTAEARLSC